MTTPWQRYLLPVYSTFWMWADVQRGQFLVSVGINPERYPRCWINSSNGQIFMAGNPHEMVAVQHYALAYKRFRAPAVPLLYLHPFAILHLLGTGQVSRPELLTTLKPFLGRRLDGLKIRIDHPCHLLGMLGTKVCHIQFDTMCDVA